MQKGKGYGDIRYTLRTGAYCERRVVLNKVLIVAPTFAYLQLCISTGPISSFWSISLH